MAKSVPDDVLDAAFDVIDLATLQIACSAQPTTYTEAFTTYKLASVTMVANTDYTKANDTSGRKVTVAAKTGGTIHTSGTATHIALVTVTGSLLRFVTTCTSQALVSGGTVDFPAWAINIEDPV